MYLNYLIIKLKYYNEETFDIHMNLFIFFI